MEPEDKQTELMLYVNALPQDVHEKLSAKNIDIIVMLADITDAYGFVLYETGYICEGVLQVLTGKESPADLAAFISKDERIEEDNRPKIFELAYEIQTKVFDVVFPIWKELGLKVLEGRMSAPLKPVLSPLSPASVQSAANNSPRATPTTISPSSSAGSYGGTQSDEKNVRALTRIATGTVYTEQRLREAFEDLPQGLRQAISSVDTANAVQAIAKKHFLHVDQMGSLASETGLVLLGLTHPADFIANLAKRLRIPEDKAKEIAKEISGGVLSKVRDALRGLHESLPPAAKPAPAATPRPAVPVNPAPLPSKLSVLSQQAASVPLPKIETPYSGDAKWKTEQTPSREEVMRDIENPREIVGPTGWKPVAAAGRNIPKPTPAIVQSVPQRAPVQPTPPIPATPKPQFSEPQQAASQPVVKMKPASETSYTAIYASKTAEPENFLEQKMSGPMSLPKEERRYSNDPYREPLE